MKRLYNKLQLALGMVGIGLVITLYSVVSIALPVLLVFALIKYLF